MTKLDYSFQLKLEEDVLKCLQCDDIVVLAAAPAAGKTQMGLSLVKKYLIDNKESKALILTHGQVLLREQWDDRIRSIDTSFKYDVIRKGSSLKQLKTTRAFIAIPQTLKKLPRKLKVDLLIVDEAHHWYRSKTVKKIISQLKPKKQILLTGTPSSFIYEGYPVVGITIDELLNYNVVCDPLIELVESNYAYDLNDYNNHYEIVNDLSNEETTHIDLDHLLQHILKRLSDENREDPTKYTWVLQEHDWKSLLQKLNKTMFVCRSQNQAIMISHYFDKFAIQYEMSISENQKNGDDAFFRFENDSNCNVMIVVNRGILGYSYTDLFNVCDLTMSLNVDRIFQLVCRSIRTSLKYSDRKLFFKLTNDAMSAVTYCVMSYVVGMSLAEYYYASTDYQATKIPVQKAFYDCVSRLRDHTKVRKPPSLKDLPRLCTFIDLKQKGTNPNSIAYTDFNTVKKLISGNIYYSIETAVQLAKNSKSLSEFRKNYTGYYKYLTRNNYLTHLKDVFPDQYKNYEWDDLGRPIRRTIKLNNEKAIAEIKKYKNRYDIKKQDVTMYKYLLKEHRVLLDKYLPKVLWTDEKVVKLAKSASKQGLSKRQFLKKYSGVESYLGRHKNTSIINDFFNKGISE